MNFDPAVAARDALTRACAHDALGDASADIEEAEDVFSSGTGAEATRAYETLLAIGERLPQAQAFQEFLIFATWQQVTEETIPRHFRKGVQLTRQFLERFGAQIEGTDVCARVTAIQESFQGGLGAQTDEIQDEYDRDAPQGGD